MQARRNLSPEEATTCYLKPSDAQDKSISQLQEIFHGLTLCRCGACLACLEREGSIPAAF